MLPVFSCFFFKRPYTIPIGNFLSAICDTSFWTFFYVPGLILVSFEKYRFNVWLFEGNFSSYQKKNVSEYQSFVDDGAHFIRFLVELVVNTFALLMEIFLMMWGWHENCKVSGHFMESTSGMTWDNLRSSPRVRGWCGWHGDDMEMTSGHLQGLGMMGTIWGRPEDDRDNMGMAHWWHQQQLWIKCTGFLVSWFKCTPKQSYRNFFMGTSHRPFGTLLLGICCYICI